MANAMVGREFLSILILAGCLSGALGACQNNACPKEQSAAQEAGLLGSSLQASCIPQQYPKQGALLPVTIPNKLVDILWIKSADPEATSKVVYAITADLNGYFGGPLHRSDYHGKADSWRDMTPVLTAALPPSEASHQPTGVMNIIYHEEKPDRILFQGLDKYYWISEDKGQTVKAVPTPGNTSSYGHEFKVHPKNPDWVLVKTRRPACDYDWRSTACAEDLLISKDFAATWTNLTAQAGGRIASFHDFDWAITLPEYEGKPTPPEAIFATAYLSSAAQKGLYPGWDNDLHFVISLDLFVSPPAKIIPCGNIFEQVAGRIFLAVPSSCPVGPDGKQRPAGSHSITGRSVTMYVAHGDGSIYEEVCLPVNLEDDGYNILHTHDGTAAFILADHAEPGSIGPFSDSPTSDAYAPAYNVSLHTLAMEHVYRRDYVADFARVEGLPGMFMANQVDAEGLKPSAKGQPTSYLRTRLTLNGGANWTSLAPPAAFRFGQCNACKAGTPEEQCRLHLHGPTSWLAPEGPHPNLYSVEAAPGLVLATGNVGAHLDFSPDADCTYISTDGGLTWQDIAENTGIYEIGDYGGAILMATHKSEGPIDYVRFSYDSGACWHKVQLPEAILVDNIRINPGNSGHIFLVHGVACYKTEAHPGCSHTGGSAPPTKLFSIDLQELLSAEYRECNHADDSPDYEPWSVPASDICLLGAKRSTRRRKPDAGCFIGSNPPAPMKQTEMCECGMDDVECEFGYYKGMDGECVAIGTMDSGACPRLANSGYLTSNTHLRLVHGNICSDINAVIPDTNGRGGPKGSHHEGGDGKNTPGSSAVKSFFSFLLIAGICIVLGGLVWSQCLTEDRRGELMDRAAPLLGALAGVVEICIGGMVTVYDWVRMKLGRMPVLGGGGDGRESYEVLGGSTDLDIDPEDHRSPPLYGQP